MSPRPLALVTGASSGIGRVFAHAFAARSYDLVVVARRKPVLDQVALELRERYGVSVHVIVCDLTSDTDTRTLLHEVDRLGCPDVVVNNAGFGAYGAFAELSMERHVAMIALNVRSLVLLTGHFLPKMLAKNHGSIIQIASTTSFQPVPYMAVYGATKAFVLSFTEAIAREVSESSVRMIAVCPGHTPTEFQHVSGADKRPTRTSSQSAEEVVEEALHAWEHGAEHVVVTGLPNKITTQVSRILPRRTLTWLVGKAFRPRRGPAETRP